MNNVLINECSGLIYSIASKYSNSYNMEDLYQAGCLGVVKALKSFDGELNVKFTTYAYNYILGEIIDYIKKDRNIKVSDDYFKIYKSYIKTKEMLSEKLLREASFDEVCDFMDIDKSYLFNVIQSTAYTKNIDSLNESTYIENNNELINKLLLDEEIDKLEEPEKSIIRYRYYFDLSQAETANITKLSQSKVSRCENRALKLIKMNIFK